MQMHGMHKRYPWQGCFAIDKYNVLDLWYVEEMTIYNQKLTDRETTVGGAPLGRNIYAPEAWKNDHHYKTGTSADSHHLNLNSCIWNPSAVIAYLWINITSTWTIPEVALLHWYINLVKWEINNDYQKVTELAFRTFLWENNKIEICAHGWKGIKLL